MTYVGQPVHTDTFQQARAKVSDGKSVRVTVPTGSGAINAGEFYYFDGFLGAAMQNLPNNNTASQSLVLNIEPAIFETDQIKTDDVMNVGTDIYWDDGEGRFTSSATAIYGGKVTVAKDNNNVIWFLLTPGVLGDAALTALGDLGSLATGVKTSMVAAANEIVGNGDVLANFLQNSVQTGLLVTAPTTDSTHADGDAYQFSVNITAGLVAVGGVLKEFVDTEDFDVDNDAISPLTDSDTGITYAIVARNDTGTITLASVAGTADAAPVAPTAQEISVEVGHDDWVLLATTTVTRASSSTCTQTYDNSVRPVLTFA